MKQINAAELKAQLNEGQEITIIDVREPWEYEEEQLHPSTRNFPLADLPHSLDQLSDLKDTAFIVHCRTGVRSNQAQKYLTKNGFTAVINLTGGLDAYVSLSADSAQ